MPSKKRATPISLQPLDALFGTNEETNNGICEIEIGSLHPFPNHPFQVKDDKKMEELAESITQYGVLVPGIVRLREYHSNTWYGCIKCHHWSIDRKYHDSSVCDQSDIRFYTVYH